MNYKQFLLTVCFLILGITSVIGQNNTITIPDVTVDYGKSTSLPISMDNTADVVAVQFILSLPEGLLLDTSSATLTERSDNHSVTVKSIGNNKYMAMVFSSSNKPLKGRTGKLMSISLTTSNALTKGTEHKLTLSDVVMGAHDGSNITTGYKAGKVTIAESADIEVNKVSAIESVATPDGKINVNWNVTNVGSLPTTGGWSEQIFLKSENGVTKLLGTAFYEGVLNVGGIISRSVELNIPSAIGIDGTGHIVVKLVPNRDSGEPSWLLDNNVAESEKSISVQKKLSISPSLINVDEANSKNVRLQLIRSGNTSTDEIFSLKRNADDRIVLPKTITIKKGQSSTYFYAQVVANKVLDNDSIVNFEISGNNYTAVSSKIVIEDDTYPSLSITTNAQDVTEGGEIKFVVSTQRVSNSDTQVKMTCDLASHFNIPSNILIPAGQTKTEVIVEAIEDDVPNVEEVVTFTVTAAKHNPASINTALVDNDVPTLQLEITPTAVSEAAGPLAVTAKIRRTDNINKIVTVKLSDDSDGGIYYGQQTIVLEKGVKETTVNLGPIDNAIVEGERTYNISAAVWIASCSCNANNGTSGGVVSVPLTVYDNDGPTLSMTSTASVLKEGGEMTVTVKRNTSSTQQIVVYLSSDHEANIEHPSSVVIPAGKNEASFTVKSKGNGINDDGFTATLSASAEGFATGNIWFTVSDQTLPDAQIIGLNVSSDEVEVGGTITVEATIMNSGAYELPELTKVGIYTDSSSSPIVTMYLQQALGVGEQITLTREITMPSSVGLFNVYAIVNSGNEVKELSYTNNNSNIQKVKTVSPYTVKILSNKSVYKPGEKALISGSIVGKDVAEKDVEVYVINDNYRHTLNAKTDSEGKFSVEYEPYSGQMGHFVAGACYPKEGLRTEMLSFDYYGVKRVTNDAITCEALFGDIYSGQFAVSNPGNLSLTNVSVEVISKPENCDVTVVCPNNVKANTEFNVGYKINATSVSEGNDWQHIELKLTSGEGVSLTTTLYYYCRNKQGQIKTDVTRINTTMIKGASRDYPFTIINTGKGETGKITIEIPSWMSYVTPREMASLAQGESATVILRMTPTEDMQLNVPVSGSIGINCINGQGLSLPFYIEPVSESTGTMVIDVCDENTYYTAEKPHVSGASVTVSHPTTGAVVASGTTGEDGKFKAVLPEGYYAVSVSAPSHNSYRNNLLVDPGVENLTTINLSIEAITVDWKVEETAVQDEYSIVSTVKYETNVPVPVVELSMPNSIDAKNLPEGESLIFYATLTNRGLITAEDVQLELPSDFRALKFEALSNNETFSLAPQQSVLIPVKVTHIGTASAKAISRVKPIDDDPCASQVGTLYYWDCGTDRKWHRYGVALQLGSCKSDDPSTWDNSGNDTYGGVNHLIINLPGFGGGSVVRPMIGGGGYYGSSSESSNVSSHKDEGCEPCQNKFLLDLIDCGLQLNPQYRILKQVLNCLHSLYTLIGKAQSGNVRNIAYGTLEAITSCIGAARSGGGDNNLERQQARQRALEDILLTLSSLKATQGQEGIGGDDIVETLGSLASSLASLAGWDVDNIEQLFCPIKLFLPCEYEGSGAGSKMRKGMSAKDTLTPSYIKEFRKNLAYPLIQQLTLVGLRYEFFGDADWMEVGQDELFTFFDVFMDSQNSDGVISEESYDKLVDSKPESISHEQVIKFVERWNNTLSENNDKPHFDCEKIAGYYDLIEHIDSVVIAKGFESVAELYEASFEKCKTAAEGSKSVCASISLQFSQKMVMTRQAFRGTLTVFNGNEETAMSDVKLELVVKDESGNVATTHEFQINPETLTGFEGELSLEDGWTLNAQQTGVATIMFIPTKYAAPTVERVYSFGGTLSYVDPFTGLTVTRDLFPVTLTVKPSPNLDLTYFMQRDIKGDDPLTEEIEPCEEAEFSLLINNVGYGDATDVKMFTEQPKIVDNEKGLLIDFELISSQLNGGEKTLALGGTVATDFGTIPAMSTSYAQWWIKSSLLGHFTDYNVEATHVTSYGNPDLSLLNDVTIHELIRSLEVEAAGKKLVGFMTNDIADAEDTPDMLYLSNGEIEAVTLAQNVNISKVSDTDYSLTVSTTQNGWNYGNIVDPTYGVSALKSVVRQSDGKEMSLRNFWQTDRTLRDGKDPLYENRIHFADNIMSANGETYILTFEPIPDLLLEVASIEGVPEERTISVEPLKNIKVVFNKYIEPATFTTDDISLAVEGTKQDVSMVSVSTDDNKTFTIDFSALNENVGNGYFTFTVNTSNIKDTEGYSGKTGKQASWIMYRNNWVALKAATYPESAGTIHKDSHIVTPVGGDYAEYGSTIKLETNSNEGYEFKNWTINGDVVSEEPAFEYMVLGDMDIKANYALKTYPVTIGETEEGGSVSGSASGVYSHGDVLNVIANPHEDYVFDGWTVNNENTGKDAELSIVVNEPKNINANFKRDVFSQSITLSRGWNWVSSYVNEPIPVENFLNNVTHVVSQFDEIINDPVYGMVGNIEALQPGASYKMESPYSTMKVFKGHLHDLTNTPIKLHTGWNWISYPYAEEKEINDVISNASEGDYMTSQFGFSEYADGYWEGTLTTLTPGLGYIYKSATDKNLLFDFVQNVSNAKALRTYKYNDDSYSADVDVHKYSSTMNVVARISSGDCNVVETECRIFAFVGNECRGVSQFVGNNHYITIYGDDAANITFVVENTANGDTYMAEENIIFKQEVVGSRKAPFTLTLSNPTKIQGVNDSSRKMQIYSVEGVLINSEATAETLKKLSRGIYIINGQKFRVK